MYIYQLITKKAGNMINGRNNLVQILLLVFYNKVFFQSADDVTVIKNTCGHYSMNEGQHRICICAKFKVPIKVLYAESDLECIVCGMSRRNIRKRLSYMLGREKEILIKL